MAYTKDQLLQAHEAFMSNGRNYAAAGRELGIDQRTVKSRVEAYYRDPEWSQVYAAAEERGINGDNISHAWVKTRNKEGDDYSFFLKKDMSLSFDEMREALVNELKAYSPIYPKIVRDVPPRTFDHVLVIDPADVHVGKLSLEQETDYVYNIDIACAQVVNGVQELLYKANAFGIDRIVLVIGNDILHIDHPHRRTTAGTPQDTDGMWWSAFLAAKKMYVNLIEMLVEYADVDLVYCPSNHDYQSGFMLADTVFSWFAKHDNVFFDESHRSINHRKYYTYGNNLIGFTHGDGAKEKDLPNLMQYEVREAWGNSKFAYWYVHHYHHKIRKTTGFNPQLIEKDHVGISVINSSQGWTPDSNSQLEYVRSPSPADPWHHRNGYVNKQAVEAFLHHYEDGQVARFTHYF